MKNLVRTSFAALMLLAAAVKASNTDPIYFLENGSLVLPNLKLGDQTYAVVLRRIGTTGFTFQLDTSQVVSLNLVNLGYTPPTAAEIVGSWTPAIGKTGSSATFNANGTYTMEEGIATPADSDCPKGGAESGNYQYEPATGVFTTVATSDSNGPNCGFGNGNSITRFKKVGTDIYVFTMENGVSREIKLTRK